MLYEWDANKAKENFRKHGVPFSAADEFAWEDAVIVVDTRREYGEERRYAIGPIHGRLHILVYTRRGRRTRIIGLRKANDRERKRYEKARKNQVGAERRVI